MSGCGEARGGLIDQLPCLGGRPDGKAALDLLLHRLDLADLRERVSVSDGASVT